ncbi:restriction endonuclease subunit S [Streptomyces sp. NBC_00467]|uniref:restriction endonuclease subunit S n=1 Tax=Streptomyces sp. NBC_00467 TaxID=2975752 RepID=UPI002E1973B8
MIFSLNWQTRRARFSFSRRDVRGADAPLASATKDGVTLRSDLEFSVWNPDSNVSNYKLVEADDFVIGLRSFQHGISHSAVRGIVSPAYTVLRSAGDLDPRFFKHYFRSSLLISHLANITQGIRQGQAIDIEAFQNLPMPVPPLEEQRRIADFLDAETARIDRLVRARESQISLLGQRLAQLVDGVVAGELEVLASIGTRVDSGNWDHGKISRFCEVIPGYAFPSSAFVTDGSGIRLLRGVNVGVGDLVWEDVVSWDTATHPVPERFHLRVGDLVLGMDRPWISSGMRITLIDESHVPAFLLQRVACLRSKSPNINMHFVHWVLRSTQFRLGVESEMTGVSVPHLSGEQIGSFTFSLPTLDEQKRLAASLEHHDSSTRRLQAAMTKQVSLLTERRQALITAAVTGQFDVSTASGRNVTDGVTA